MKDNNFKETLIERTYKYSIDIITFIDTLNRKDLSIEIISKQLIRSATSIAANIIEAQAASSTKDFINFLNHSLKSANESIFWLKLLKDTHKSDSTYTDKLIKETSELANILGASILKLRKKI